MKTRKKKTLDSGKMLVGTFPAGYCFYCLHYFCGFFVFLFFCFFRSFFLYKFLRLSVPLPASHAEASDLSKNQKNVLPESSAVFNILNYGFNRSENIS